MRSDNGYTLVEVSIALAVSGIILGFAYESYLFGQRLVSEWRSRISAEEAFHLFTERISDDLLDARSVVDRSQGWLFVLPDGDSLAYAVSDSAIYRNDQQIIRGYAVDVSLRNARVRENSKRMTRTIHVQVSLISRNGTTLTRTIKVRPRHQSEWPAFGADLTEESQSAGQQDDG